MNVLLENGSPHKNGGTARSLVIYSACNNLCLIQIFSNISLLNQNLSFSLRSSQCGSKLNELFHKVIGAFHKDLIKIKI